MPARQLRIQLETIGLRGWRGLPGRTALGSRLQAYEICRPLVERRRGLEIGGPSAIFARNGPLPLYPLFDGLDNCDFAGDTIWHGEAAEGAAFVYDDERPPGRRFIRDATSLDGIDDASYDVVLASHTLEHIANPFRALVRVEADRRERRSTSSSSCRTWRTPSTTCGPVTTLEHIEADFARSTGEDDTTHVAGVRRALRPEARPRSAVPPGLRAANARAGGESHRSPPRLRHRPRRAAARSRRLPAPLGRDGASVSHRRRRSSQRARARQRRFLAPTAGWRRESVFRRDRVLASPARARRQTRAFRPPPASSTAGRPRPDRRRARPEAPRAGRPREGARARASLPG